MRTGSLSISTSSASVLGGVVEGLQALIGQDMLVDEDAVTYMTDYFTLISKVVGALL